MADQATGTGFANIAGGIGSLLTGLGGNDGIGNDIGDVICNAKGTCVPKSVTYVQPGNNAAMPSMVWLIGGAALIVVLVLVLKK